MSFPYNDILENPDYHYSETLEIDQVRPSQRNTHNSDNPYAPFGSDKKEGEPILIPLKLVQNPDQSEYPPTDYGFELPSTNSSVNPSFEYEPESEGILPTTSHAFNIQNADSYSDASERVNIVQRRSRRSNYATFARSSLLRLDPEYIEAKRKEEEKLINDLSRMSTHERVRAIQKIPKSMKEKREIRNRVLTERKKKSYNQDAHLNCCAQCFYNTALFFRQLKNSFVDCLQLFQFWQKTLKDIGSQFGTSIHSYFVFLTWLLTFNIFSFLINFSFLAIPQLIAAQPNHLSFTSLEFLTGAGYFTNTVLYSGFYTNGTVGKIENASPYYMQLAYIFTIGIYFIICFLSLIYSMAKSFRNHIVMPQMHSRNAAKLLCIWDFSVVDEKAVQMNQKNISTQIKETLSEMHIESLKLSLQQRILRISLHLAMWFLSLGLAVASCAGIYFFSLVNLELFLNEKNTQLQNEAAMLILPIVVSLFNHVMPFLYSFSSLVEKFTYPRHQIYTAIIRNVILKISIIGILCYYWLNIVALSKVECWETFIGQDIYRLLIVDFVCCLLGSFFGEFLLRLIGTKCWKKLGVPEFDIARNVLDLIYAQTLTWIGIFFAPLLPAIQMISFFIIICVKKISLLKNCQPPRKAWRGSQMNTVFVFLLFFPSFVGVLSVVAVTVWRRRPSEACGPFRGLNAPFEAISGWISVLSSSPSSGWVVWIYHNLIKSTHFFFILSIIVLMLIYFFLQVINGRKTMVKLLQEQIANAGKDKMFLLKKLRALQASKLPSLRRQPERDLSLNQLPREPSSVLLPSCVDPFLWTEDGESSTESARHPGMATFNSEAGEITWNAGPSDALVLALRARQEAERETGDEESLK
ncbi:transmembrane channel-like protein 5 isoform X2 [Notechis scutatus]|uniref:Transmembrane channel-like protein n=1 Tax=Notechis scutatus TaxID=8663 RepID=A0A6J1V4Q4_9SAUR|nr:transmembrane channel-like protein 5 isoform X2 [Notechis scutatus]